MSVKWLFNPCHAHRRNISLLASGVLPVEERAIVEDHLRGCAECRSRFNEITALTQQLERANRRWPEVQPSETMRLYWRRAVLAVEKEPHFLLSCGAALLEWWRELRTAHRAAISGFAATWLAIIFFSATAPDVPVTTSASVAPPPKKIFMVLRADERQFARLLGHVEPEPAEPPPPVAPRPRSERREVNIAV